jgi:hypothetical protein
MNASYSGNNSSMNGKTRHFSNNIFKKNGTQNDSINSLTDLGTESIAAKASVSSASSLTTSLNKLNIK